jgi:hypothetical protein
MTNTWKIFAFGSGAIAVLAAANLEVRSHGRDNVVTRVSYAQPTSFVTGEANIGRLPERQQSPWLGPGGLHLYGA